MKNFWAILCVVIVIFILVLSSVLYQVRVTETVIVTRFGKPIDTQDEPGLGWKWPAPIDTVHRFDSRSRLFENIPEMETTTAGGEPIIVKSYLVWKIEEPEKFLVSVKDVKSAEDKLKSQLLNAQNSVIGKHYFSEFVNTDPSQIYFEAIEEEIAGEIKREALDKYGIEIRTVGIKRLKISKEVTEKVFERMKADRNRKTEAILAAGNSEAERIKSDADAKQKELLSVAEAIADEIRGAGDAEAARYYEMLEVDPELAIFLRKIDAFKKSLAQRSTFLLTEETDLIRLLKELPDIEPAQKSETAGK